MGSLGAFEKCARTPPFLPVQNQDSPPDAPLVGAAGLLFGVGSGCAWRIAGDPFQGRTGDCAWDYRPIVLSSDLLNRVGDQSLLAADSRPEKGAGYEFAPVPVSGSDAGDSPAVDSGRFDASSACRFGGARFSPRLR